MSARIFNRLTKIYHSPQGYWKGFAAIKKLAQAAKVSEDVAQNRLDEASSLAGLFTSPMVHSKTEI